mmetsp:Transcript_29741/g.45080  ORF Transcript_29741/g.45080 Transcript_29741/m.45080 type:complete len:220 (+) Transcript_29741:189-848(+)
MAATKSRKKKRISKHVLKSKESQQQSSELQTNSNSAAFQAKAPKEQPKRSKKAGKIKDPKEAERYLSAWKYRETAGGWKFNKNTQSWLFRHMYDVEKISKVPFTLLMEYMEGLKGSTKTRVIEDAERRAVRYKEFEKTLEVNKNKNEGEHAKNESSQESGGPNSSSVNELKSEISLATVDTGGEDDQTRWKRLSDHDKRKEYKRARKVLDLFRKENLEP